MENTLKIYYEKNTNLLLLKGLKMIIAEEMGCGANDKGIFTDKPNGFCFVFDDETEGKEEITWGDKDEKTGFIEIKAGYAYEAIHLYNLIENYISAKEI